MERIFEGKVGIVTGGSFGIGRAHAVAFDARGAKVVIGDWLEDKEQNTLKQIKADIILLEDQDHVAFFDSKIMRPVLIRYVVELLSSKGLMTGSL